MENNSTFFYTTAQVTEMVELSDQNVRKYVRLLEDRNYEVAKDEHNRRLFSGEDVAVLRELIKLAKQPGYTLETAADQLASNATGGQVVNANSRVPSVETSNEFTQLLTSVVDKMQEMQNDQNELKEKMDLLLSKLDETSMALENSAHIQNVGDNDEKSEDGLSAEEAADADAELKDENSVGSVELESEAEVSGVASETESRKEKDSVENSDADTLEDKDLTEEVDQSTEEEVKTEKVEQPEEEIKTEEAYTQDETSAQKFEAEKRENETRIDMSEYQKTTSEDSSEQEAQQKSVWGRFVDFISGK